MTDRREFLQAGLAVSLIGSSALAAANPFSSEQTGHPLVSLHRVLVDANLNESVAFGVEASRLGAVTHTFRGGDITDFWYHELDALWRKEKAPIAGLTRHGPLFVLERFAWDRGMRVVFRGEHGAEANGMVHALSGPKPTLDGALNLINAGTNWPVALASGVTQCVQGCADISKLAAFSDQRFSQPETLYSWVIA